LVGGTMLYLDAILQGYKFPKTSLKLRAELENYSTEKLLIELKESDPETYKKIDKNNRRRIIRAMESYLVNQSSHLNYKKKKPNFEYLILGIERPRQELYKRIDKRLDERIKLGMIEEVQSLHERGVSWEKLTSFGLEYRFISEYLQGHISRKAMIEKLKFKIHGYARRQLTWWRRNKRIIWLNADKNLAKNAQNLVNEFLD
jgi:tRNA dimethylallyltransferase